MELCVIKYNAMKKIITRIISLVVLTSMQAQQRNDIQVGGNNTQFKNGCGAPVGVFVDEITAISATIHWNTNGAAYYKVQFYNVNDPREKGTLMTNLGSVMLDNLSPCGTYKFIITAKCADGFSKTQVMTFRTQGCGS